jgi:nucleotide-binding universal stress UspA family protein
MSIDDHLSPVLCGVDGSAGASAAVAGAVCVSPEHASIVLATVADASAAAHPEAAVTIYDRAAAVLADARRAAGARPTQERVFEGDAVAGLLAAVERFRPGLLAVGRRARGEGTGDPVTGDVGRAIVEAAPCSVLLAEPGTLAGGFPQRVVVGVDGSTRSMHALAVADEIATRAGVEIEALAAGDLRAASRGATAPSISVRESEEDPATALCHAAGHADLLVVGASGSGEQPGLGSVTRAVLAGAEASILVVRCAPDSQS